MTQRVERSEVSLFQLGTDPFAPGEGHVVDIDAAGAVMKPVFAAGATGFRRPARDYEQLASTLASTLAGYHWLAFASLLLKSLFQSP